MTAFCVLSFLFLANTNWKDLESQDFFYLISTLAVVLLIFLLFLIIKYNLAYEGKVTVKREKKVRHKTFFNVEYLIQLEKDGNVFTKKISKEQFNNIDEQNYVKKMPGSFRLLTNQNYEVDDNSD